MISAKLTQLTCSQCHKIFIDYKSNHRDSRIFCSRKCFGKSMKGSTLNLSHGMTNTPFYNKWSSIKRRCFNRGQQKYKFFKNGFFFLVSSYQKQPQKKREKNGERDK